MPRRSVLSAAERENLLALSDTKDDLIQYCSLSRIRRFNLRREVDDGRGRPRAFV